MALIGWFVFVAVGCVILLLWIEREEKRQREADERFRRLERKWLTNIVREGDELKAKYRL
jgi:hypothetical protein